LNKIEHFSKASGFGKTAKPQMRQNLGKPLLEKSFILDYR
jgi:hypothetical protein